MREILLFIASLAGATVLTALAIVLRPESPIWRFLLWGGIAVFVACALVIVLDHLRPGGRAEFLIGTGLGFAIFIGFAIAYFSESALPPTLQVDAYANNAEYPDGSIVSGIKFHHQFTETTILLKNGSDKDFDDLVFVFQFDEPIAAIAQKSNVSNVIFEEKNGMDTRVMIIDATGKKTAVPNVVLLATDAGYRMRCPRLASQRTMQITVALSDVIQEQHPEWKELPASEQVKQKKNVWLITMLDGSRYYSGYLDGDVWGARRSPAWLKIEGNYKIDATAYPLSKTITFQPMTFEHPKGVLDGIFSIQK